MIRHPKRKPTTTEDRKHKRKHKPLEGSSSLHTNHRAVHSAPAPQTAVVARGRLETTIRRLEIALACAVVCDLALTGQNVERDHEIAQSMRWSVVDPLSRQIDALDRTLRAQQRAHPNTAVHRDKIARGGRKRRQSLRLSRGLLDDICNQLDVIVSAASVCCAALKTQGAETDVEIATTLKHSFIDILRAEISGNLLANRLSQPHPAVQRHT